MKDTVEAGRTRNDLDLERHWNTGGMTPDRHPSHSNAAERFEAIVVNLQDDVAV